MRLIKKTKEGFTLVELMIVVAIIGVLAALAIYGVRRYVYTSKTAEARTALGRMSKDASNAFNFEHMAGSVLPLGTTAGSSNVLCADAAATVPSTSANIQGKKYQSGPQEWQDSAGWECLGFSMQDPQYYMYNYAGSGTGASGDMFTTFASGDLDGDGVTSDFQMQGKIQTQSNELVVVVSPNIIENNPFE